jgi:hypothetical protein
MIENDQQLEATYQALGGLYRALASLRKSVLPVNPRQYAVFAEGPVAEICKMEAEINACLGVDKTEAAQSPDFASVPVPALRETPPPYGKNGH